MFVLVTVAIVYTYTLIVILVYGDKKLSLIYGFFLNKLTAPFFITFIFSEILFRFDDFKWGLTQKIQDDPAASELLGEPVDTKVTKAKTTTRRRKQNVDNVEDENELSEIIIAGKDNKTKLKNLGTKRTDMQNMMKKAVFKDREDMVVISEDPANIRKTSKTKNNANDSDGDGDDDGNVESKLNPHFVY